MVKYICPIICIILALFSYYRNRKLYNPSFVFCIYWAFLMILASLRLYNLYETSDLAYSIITCGVLFFFVGASIGNNLRISESVKCFNLKNYKICLILCIMSLLLNFQVILNFFTRGFSVDQIYYMMAATTDGTETELSSLYNTNLVRLQQYIGYPLLYTIVPISIIEYISSKKKIYLYIAIAFSLLRFLFDLRRTYIVIIVVFLIFLFYILADMKRIQFGKGGSKIKIIGAFVAFIAIFGAFSSSRRGTDASEEYSVFSNFYYYYAGSIPYLSQRLDLLNNFEPTLGLTSFRGFFAPIFVILISLGIVDPHLMEVATANIDSLHGTVLYITNSHPFNSYATCFFEFYMDGGLFGVIIFSLFFGLYAQILYLKMIKLQDNRSLMKFCLFCSLYIYLSVLIFEAGIICYIWPFIIEKFIYRGKIKTIS